MQGIILLNHDENTRQVEEEEKFRFLHNLLDQMGVPIKDFWDNDIVLTVEQKIQLRNIVSNYNIQIIDNNEEMQVYLDKEIIGVFRKPEYKLKRDLQQLDRKKQLFLEMQVNSWTIFEETEQ